MRWSNFGTVKQVYSDGVCRANASGSFEGRSVESLSSALCPLTGFIHEKKKLNYHDMHFWFLYICLSLLKGIKTYLMGLCDVHFSSIMCSSGSNS